MGERLATQGMSLCLCPDAEKVPLLSLRPRRRTPEADLGRMIEQSYACLPKTRI